MTDSRKELLAAKTTYREAIETLLYNSLTEAGWSIAKIESRPVEAAMIRLAEALTDD